MKRVLFSIILLIFLCSCGVFSQRYRHEVTGREVECRAFGWGLVGFPVAVGMFWECKRGYEGMGYVEVVE